jgi:hypothetical protein
MDLKDLIPPDWFWKALTILIGAWAAWTAWQQHRVARDKLRLDLFEKRLAIYEEVKYAITAVRERNQVDLPRFRQAAASSVFLFGSDVRAYLEEVYGKLLYIAEYGANVRLTAAIVPEHAPEEVAVVEWLNAQPEKCVGVFAPYMSFSKAKAK